MSQLSSFSLSVKGKRKNNQDDCIVFSPNKNLTFLAVADGMGGHEGGAVASKLTLNVAIEIINSEPEKEYYDLKEILQRIYSAADAAIAAHTQKNNGLTGMGTTLCCVLINHDRFALANIGDSRVYFFSAGSFHQITEDHTVVQEYIDTHGPGVPKNILAESHVLTRALTGEGDTPDFFPKEREYSLLKKGNAFLLCSDGLIPKKNADYNRVFANYLTRFPDPEAAGRALIELAEESGSTDNITVVIAEYGDIQERKPGSIATEKQPAYADTDSQADLSPEKKRLSKGNRILLFFLFTLFFILSGVLLLHNTDNLDKLNSLVNKGMEFFKTKEEKETSEQSFRISWDDGDVEENVKQSTYLVYLIEKSTGDTLQIMESENRHYSFSLSGNIDSKKAFEDQYELKGIKMVSYGLSPGNFELNIVEKLKADTLETDTKVKH